MKNHKKTIDKKFSFANRFLAGMVVALSLTLTAFEWTTVKTEVVIPTLKKGKDVPIIMPPITYRTEKLEKPKPISNTDQIEIVEILTKPIIEPEPEPTPKTEPGKNVIIDPNAYGMGNEEIDENIIHTSVQIFAHYENCAAETGEALATCSKLEIMDRVRNSFEISHQLRDAGGLQKAFISFVIDKEGNITDVQAINPSSKAMERDAIKAIKRLPKMNPAQQQGRNVFLRITIPLRVQL